MRKSSNASIYHGFRGQLPNELPSNDLSRSLLINRLHGIGSASSDGTTYQQYLARKQRSDPPPRKLSEALSSQLTSTSSTSIQDERNAAFLRMYGISSDDIKSTVVPSGVTSECASKRALLYNPDREQTLLPPSDLDASVYDILTPTTIKEASYTIITYDDCCVEYTDDNFEEVYATAYSEIAVMDQRALKIIEPDRPIASCSPQIETYISEDITDEGYISSSSQSVETIRGCSPVPIGTDVQLSYWYTGRPKLRLRKSFTCQSVKLRRRRHGRKGVHSLCSERYPRDTAVAQTSAAYND